MQCLPYLEAAETFKGKRPIEGLRFRQVSVASPPRSSTRPGLCLHQSFKMVSGSGNLDPKLTRTPTDHQKNLGGTPTGGDPHSRTPTGTTPRQDPPPVFRNSGCKEGSPTHRPHESSTRTNKLHCSATSTARLESLRWLQNKAYINYLNFGGSIGSLLMLYNESSCIPLVFNPRRSSKSGVKSSILLAPNNFMPI